MPNSMNEWMKFCLFSGNKINIIIKLNVKTVKKRIKPEYNPIKTLKPLIINK